MDRQKGFSRAGCAATVALLCCALGAGFARAADPGALDPTFGNDGVARTTFGHAEAEGWAMAVQPDGKIVLVGFGAGTGPAPADSPSDLTVARLLPNGAPDATFGDGGVVSYGSPRRNERGIAVDLQRDGSVVVAGWAETGRARTRGLLLRFDASGHLDESFGNKGKVLTAFEGSTTLQRLLVASDGDIVVAGERSDQDGGYRSFLMRYTPRGRRDRTFSKTGRALLPPGISLTDLAEQRDGKIVASGYGGQDARLAVLRFRTDGALDSDFAKRGIARARSKGVALALTIDGSDRIVAAGFRDAAQHRQIALARFLADGRPDPAFGKHGTVRTSLEPQDAYASDVIVAPNGAILVGGALEQTLRRFAALVRYREDGELDPDFGDGGVAITRIGVEASLFTLAFQDPTHLVACGWTWFWAGDGGSEAIVWRHLY